MKRFILLLLLMSAPAFAQTVTESCSGTGALSGNWTNTSASGYDPIQRVSGACAPIGTNHQGLATYTGTTFSNDQFAQYTLSTCEAGSSSGPVVRMTTAGTGYVWLCAAKVIYLLSAGGGAGSTGISCPTVNNGDVIRLSVQGTTLSCIDETTGQSGTGSNSTYSTGAPGMLIDQRSGGGDTGTNFVGGTYSAISANPTILITSSTGNSVTLTGTGTSWTPGTPGSPTFTVSGVACSITAQTIVSSTSATLTMNAGGTQGACTITDPSLSNTTIVQIHTPQTWYIRTDGGNAATCTGLTNASDPGTGATPRPCALIHPAYLLKVGGIRAWRSDYIGGDTVQFALNTGGTPGSYFIGQRNTSTGRGLDMSALGFTWCTGDQFDCDFPPIPSGTAAFPSKWLGPCAPNCSNTQGTDLVSTATTLSGINGIFWILNVQGTNHFEINGFHITQPDQCTIVSSVTGSCVGGNDFASRGISMAESNNVGPANGTIHNVSIHGIANEAMHGSSWNLTSSDVMNFDHIYMRGNGFTNFDPDNGNCHTTPVPCEGQGTINITYSISDFAGCVMSPTATVNATTGLMTPVNYCYSQSTGGQGDGIVLIPLQNGTTVNVKNNMSRYNTQDGFDFLHDEDPSGLVQINFQNNLSIGNMGQVFKFRGGGTTTTAYNNIGVGNGRTMLPAYSASNPAFSGFPAGWNTGLPAGDSCRAGDTVVLIFNNGHTVTFTHNTIATYCPVSIDVQCSGTCSGTDLLKFQDNIFMGFADPQTPFSFPSNVQFVGGITDPSGNAGSTVSYNQWYQIGSACPQFGTESNQLCTNPQFTSSSSIDTLNPLLTTSSPGFHSGVTAGLLTDYYGNLWAIPSPSRGFAEISFATTLINFTLKGQIQVQQ